MAAQRNILELQNVKRAFGNKVVLSGVNLAVGFGELVALYGPSGSGKSTLLNLVGAIDRPSEGTIHLAGRDVSRMWEMNRTKLRRTQIGFIFQNYPLIAAYSAAENIDMSLRLKGVGLWERRRRIKASLEAVGLSDHARRLPDQLSGGQQQRVAIARVLALHPTIILADEPTSGLDTRTARRVMKIFQGLAQAEGTAFLVVSHDIDLTERFVNRAYDLRDGQLALRPPIGTVVEDHDALEARRREVNAHFAKQEVDENDDWSADEPEFLAELPRDDAPIRLGDPEFLRGVTVDDLPAGQLIAAETQDVSETLTQDAEPEIADPPTPLFTEMVGDEIQTPEQKDVQAIADMLNDAQVFDELPDDSMPHEPILEIPEMADDVPSIQEADSGLTKQVEDGVEDTDTPQNAPDDQDDHRPS